MHYICVKELVGRIEKFHCLAVYDNGPDLFLCETSPDAYEMLELVVGGIKNKYFDTRAEALAALTTVDPDHGLS